MEEELHKVVKTSYKAYASIATRKTQFEKRQYTIAPTSLSPDLTVSKSIKESRTSTLCLPRFDVCSQADPITHLIRNKSVEKCHFIQDEQSNSLSEQAAWDNYQEKYMSEVYSEDHDSDAVRKLVNFGEDYTIFLDAPSGCSISSNNSHLLNQTISAEEYDSMKKRFLQSQQLLQQMRNIYLLQVSSGLHIYVTVNEIGEIAALCDRHLHLLQNTRPTSKHAKNGLHSTPDILLDWERLKKDSLRLQEYIFLQGQVIGLDKCLLRCQQTIDSELSSHILAKIFSHGSQMRHLRACRKKLLELNVVIHRFILRNTDYSDCRLKRDVSELYRLCGSLHVKTQKEAVKWEMELNKEDIHISTNTVRQVSHWPKHWINSIHCLGSKRILLPINVVVFVLLVLILFPNPQCCETMNSYYVTHLRRSLHNARERPPI